MPEGFHRAPQAEAAARASRREALDEGAGSTGRTPRRWRSRRCSRQGVPIRLTGQDTERGTFSQRHLVFHDAEDRRRAYTPIQHLPRRRRAVRAAQQPAVGAGLRSASSTATASQAPEALVLWEAQFGDFVNGAQVIIDQFLVSGLAKWGQTIAPHAAAAARLRGLRVPSTPAAASSASCSARRGQHPRGQLHHARAVLPPAAPPGARVQAAAADRDDAEEPAAAAGRRVDASTSWPRAGFQRVHRRPGAGGRRATRSRGCALHAARSTTTSPATRSAPTATQRRGRPRGAALSVPDEASCAS